MDRYVIRDTYDMKFLESIDENGINTSIELKKALIFEDLEKAKHLLEFIDDEDFIIQEIEFKDVEVEKDENKRN